MKKLLAALVGVAFAFIATPQEKKGADQAIIVPAPSPQKSVPAREEQPRKGAEALPTTAADPAQTSAPAKKKMKKNESKKGGADKAIIPPD